MKRAWALLFPTPPPSEAKTVVNIRRSRRDYKPHARPPTLPPERLRHLARRVHALGDRVFFEFLTELDRDANLHERLEKYAELDRYAGFIKALNGDRLPPPARLVRAWRP